MSITLVNPNELPKIDAYRQVSVATGSKLVFVAGQVAWDADGNTIGAGDLATQVEHRATSTSEPPWPRSVPPSPT
ncbi:RidA family protein [Rhodococcus aetherivorans]|uniref:RidA family protein n=1 Tax=Rhodococcus aetherivorans TaxID=191292 RepID=UPI003F5E3F07